MKIKNEKIIFCQKIETLLGGMNVTYSLTVVTTFFSCVFS